LNSKYVPRVTKQLSNSQIAVVLLRYFRLWWRWYRGNKGFYFTEWNIGVDLFYLEIFLFH